MKTGSESWFNENFVDVRERGPKPGEVMVKYRANAHFVDGPPKRQVIDLLLNDKKTGADMAIKTLTGCGAVNSDAIDVALKMAEMLSTQSPEKVAAGEFPMVIEYTFWTKPEHVPVSPHWSRLRMLNTELESHFKVTYS